MVYAYNVRVVGTGVLTGVSRGDVTMSLITLGSATRARLFDRIMGHFGEEAPVVEDRLDYPFTI